MDLSKIPEPSEDDLSNAIWLLFEYSRSTSGYTRVIAHLLRHGSVLADYVRRDDDSHVYIGNNTLLDIGPLAEAVTFFEKFGGNDER